MASRTGVPTIIHSTNKLNIFMVSHNAKIKQLYPSDNDLAAKLDAALAANQALLLKLLQIWSVGD